MKTVSVVLPTLNEKDALENSVNEILLQEKKLPGWKIGIVISDSGSTDGTVEIAKKLVSKNSKIHLINVGFGLGVGLIEGHRYALNNINPDILTQMDADGQVEVDILPKLVKTIEDGFDLALGSRFVKGGKNNLSLSRRIFSLGLSWVCRTVMGPFNVREFANSARAFTPALFKKINLDRLPWREKSYINQPAFVNEAVLAGAKYKEIPLVFKNRAEGYSKNKVLNYTYDVFTYVIDARLKKWGINFNFFEFTHKIKTLVKFSLVGVSGTVVDFIVYKFLINLFKFTPPVSKIFSTEVGIVNNFIFNNFWTFRHRKTGTNISQRFGIYNLVSLGGLVIAVLVVQILHSLYGDGSVSILGRSIAFNNFYFFATIPPVMIWNFTVNHFVTWRHKKSIKN